MLGAMEEADGDTSSRGGIETPSSPRPRALAEMGAILERTAVGHCSRRLQRDGERLGIL